MIDDKHKWQILFGLNLKRVMDETGYSQRQLSDITGIRQPTISAYVNGLYSPSITSVVALCQTMYVDYHVLLEADIDGPIARRYEFFSDEINEADWIDDFGMIFRSIMLKESCSQSELANGTNISQGLISKYLKGRTIPSAYAIMRIAHYLSYDYDELLELGRVYISRGF